jgi:hypothetical protein
MMPPTRIEQLNNFQDAVQSPDGLDRLRALQAVEQALPSSQGLMGMPQVQAPMPMVPRQYGGEVGTGGLLEVLDDGTQVFSNTEKGILNRAIHGGMLQGQTQTQTATAPSSFSGGPTAAGTLASGTSSSTPAVLPKDLSGVDNIALAPLLTVPSVQDRGGVYNASEIRDAGITLSRPSDAPETIVQQGQAQVGSMYRDPVTGKIPYALYNPQPINTFGQGYDLKDMDYFTANALALGEGADRFIYNNEYAAVDPGLLSNYNYSELGTKPYGDAIQREKIDNETFGGKRDMHGNLMPVSSSDKENARLKAEGFKADYSGRLTVPGTSRAEQARELGAMGVNLNDPYLRQMYGFKHGGQIISKQYGGEIGTGGLVEILNDGTQVFNKTQEGILNRAIHGGMLQGQTQTETTPSGSSFSGGPTAAGTLASGTTAPSAFTISTGQDKYGNTIGDLTGMKDYYDLNFAARDAGQDTFMYGEKLMQVDPGYLRGGGINPFISNRLPAGLQQEVIDRPDLFRNITNLNTITKIQGDPTDPGFYSEAPYLPTQDFSKDISGQYNSYYEANQAAKEAGSPTFMYGDKLAKTDPGLLPDYVGGPKPFISNAIPEKYISAGVNLPPGWANMSANQLAKYQPGYKDPNRTIYGSASGGQVIKREGGGQVNPSQAAQGLASFGRYGDNILVHMNPEELEGLASLGQITYNPVTGLPEAFSLKGIFKAVRKIAPIALAIAAPYAFGATTALGIGASTALGSFAGNLIAGAKPGDALKAGLMSGLFAGGGAYLGGAASGFGSAGSQAAGQGAAGYGSAAMGSSAGVNQAGQAMYGSTAGSSALKAGLKAPVSMGAKGLGQGLAGGGGSQFSGVASYGNIPRAAINTAARPPLQLAPKPVVEGTTVFGMPKNPNMAQIGQQQAGQTVQNFTPTPVENIATINPNIVQPNQFNQTLTGADLATYSKQQGLNQLPYESPTADLRIQSRAQLEGTPTRPSIFQDSSMDNFKRIGQNIYDDYSTKEGIAKLVAMDLSTPDYDIMYANEAREKEQQLRDAGYTVETDFNKQTVIRDSKGVIQPRNLTASMLLDQALGKVPRTNLVARYGYGPKDAKQGGLISLKHGGEFSGMVPGDGHGMEDNVYMPITEGPKQVGTLAVSPSEYVVDSYTMAALGNGNADAGAKVMDRVVKHVRKKAYGDTEQPNEISGLQALKPMMERV